MSDSYRNDNTNRIQQPQAGAKHPPEWQQDLSPDHMAGQNLGAQSGDREQGLRTAYDVKPLHRRMSDWQDDDLRQIPLLPEGERLQQGATYLDLENPQRGEIRAMGDMEAGSAYVAKDRVPYQLWNRLRGVDDVERTQGEGPRD